LKQMQERFDDMQNTIVNRIDDMGTLFWIILGKRIDDIEKSVTDLMNDLGNPSN
jgi:heat shock factor-binding protein 1